jgi:hypothetical protein
MELVVVVPAVKVFIVIVMGVIANKDSLLPAVLDESYGVIRK